MARHTAESLLISALINTGDHRAHEPYGVLGEHFFGYRAEFEWVVSYGTRFGRAPTPSEVAVQFPDFPHNPDQEEVKWACSEVVRQYSARKLSRALLKAGSDLKSGNIEEAFEHLSGVQLFTVAERPKNMLVDRSFMEEYDREIDPIPVPWPTLTKYTGGIHPGELWYLAARPGNGKTSNTLKMLTDATLAGTRVALYSLEMTKFQIQTKVHAIMAREMGIEVSQRAMLTRQMPRWEYRELLDKIEERMSFAPDGRLDIFTPADGIVTPATIAAHASEYDLIAVDYIGLMDSGSGAAVDDWRVLAKISNSLKQIALRYNVAVLAASQINREGERTPGRPPRLKDLSGSDALGQDGDVVITMAQMGPTAEAFSLEKNRHGMSGYKWWAAYEPDRGEFGELRGGREEAESRFERAMVEQEQ